MMHRMTNWNDWALGDAGPNLCTQAIVRMSARVAKNWCVDIFPVNKYSSTAKLPASAGQHWPVVMPLQCFQVEPKSVSPPSLVECILTTAVTFHTQYVFFYPRQRPEDIGV